MGNECYLIRYLPQTLKAQNLPTRIYIADPKRLAGSTSKNRALRYTANKFEIFVRAFLLGELVAALTNGYVFHDTHPFLLEG